MISLADTLIARCVDVWSLSELRPASPFFHTFFLDNEVAVMELPTFSQWVPWSERYSLKDCDHLGMYLLRRFDVEPTTHPGPVDAELLYVGITCDRTLKKRWYEFNRSAYERKNGHSGGWTFNSLYCGSEIAEVHPWLFVSCLPVCLEEPKLSAYIQFVERWLIWEHVQRYGKMPACNIK